MAVKQNITSPSRAKPVRVKRRNRSPLSPLLVTVAAAAVFSGVVAGVWQISSAPAPEEEPFVLGLDGASSSSEGQPAPAPAQPEDGFAAVFVPESSEAPASPESEASQPQESPPSSGGVQGALAESPRVTSAYFDDAVFVGDSITTGIKIYDAMSNTTVLAATGINLASIHTKPCIQYGEETLTIMEALARMDPKKIYVMMGANGLGSAGDDWTIEQYGALLDSIKKMHPDSIIYVQSILPVNEEKFKAKYNNSTTNADIDRLNERLAALSAEKGACYLDLASAFKDENGAMPADFTPDGIHLNSAQYITWFDYLKTHTLVEE